MKPATIIRRDGTAVEFALPRIARAIAKALAAVGHDDVAAADELAVTVLEHLERCHDRPQLGIEDIQDAVVHVLQESGHYDAAIAYCRYRDARERHRRSGRLLDDCNDAPNLTVVEADGRRRSWDRAQLGAELTRTRGLDAKAAEETVRGVEELLVGTVCTELSGGLYASLVDTALVRAGRHHVVQPDLRLDQAAVGALVQRASDGRGALHAAGGMLLNQLALSEGYAPAVARLWGRGRLWIDGLDDPRRGSQITVVVDGPANPWLIMTQAFALAARLGADWRRVRLVLPPAILGHLERGAQQLLAPLADLARMAQPYLYCDGRTPLLAQWPFAGGVGLATYQEDFLLAQRLTELGIPSLSGSHYAAPGPHQRIAVELAINAQGLDGAFAAMDQLAMALVSAAQVRLAQLGALADGADVRFAIFGLVRGSDSGDYLERQVLQEGLRAGIRVVRGVNLPEAACAHLGRLLE